MSDHFHNPKDASATNSKLLLCSLFITVSFMIVEVIGGVLSGSLTLLADAGHMFADAFALFLSWFSIIISQKPADN
ncbi:MAG: cation transporter, partial [Rickettsiaceae bacterium]|nr:cation transporter [Rickettsiaceae bacterium]